MEKKKIWNPPEEGVGVPDLNMVAAGLLMLALGVCAIQFAIFGHFARVRDVDSIMASGWLVTMLSFASLGLLVVSASTIGSRFWREPISWRFMAPLAIATTLFVLSGTFMLAGSPDVRQWQRTVGIYYWAQSH